MKTFPLFLKTTNRLVVIYGGGEQAAQKARLIGKSDARVVVAAPVLNRELRELAEDGAVTHLSDLSDPALSEGAAIAFAATGCPGADAALVQTARAQGAVVNAVDAPDLCDAYVPSIVDRDPVVVAIGTEGTAPVLAGQIKTKVEEYLEVGVGDLARLAGSLRSAVAQRVAPHKRRAFWRWVFGARPRTLFAEGRVEAAQKTIEDAIEAGGAPESHEGGFVSLIGAGPGSRDLITLRGVERLQNADVIFYDRLIDESVLELARRDAERICVGKEPGAHSWAQDRINGVIAAEGRKGRRVVRLKCGDPGIFGRVAEEIEALTQAGVAWEIVPGVTSAAAAAASIGRPLTERGVADTLVLTTGRNQDGNPAAHIAQHLLPGTTVAIYMGVGQASAIQDQLLEHGLDNSLPIEIVESAETPEARVIKTTIGALPGTIMSKKVKNPAMILITRAQERAENRAAQNTRLAVVA